MKLLEEEIKLLIFFLGKKNKIVKNEKPLYGPCISLSFIGDGYDSWELFDCKKYEDDYWLKVKIFRTDGKKSLSIFSSTEQILLTTRQFIELQNFAQEYTNEASENSYEKKEDKEKRQVNKDFENLCGEYFPESALYTNMFYKGDKKFGTKVKCKNYKAFSLECTEESINEGTDKTFCELSLEEVQLNQINEENLWYHSFTNNMDIYQIGDKDPIFFDPDNNNRRYPIYLESTASNSDVYIHIHLAGNSNLHLRKEVKHDDQDISKFEYLKISKEKKMVKKLKFKYSNSRDSSETKDFFVGLTKLNFQNINVCKIDENCYLEISNSEYPSGIVQKKKRKCYLLTQNPNIVHFTIAENCWDEYEPKKVVVSEKRIDETLDEKGFCKKLTEVFNEINSDDSDATKKNILNFFKIIKFYHKLKESEGLYKIPTKSKSKSPKFFKYHPNEKRFKNYSQQNTPTRDFLILAFNHCNHAVSLDIPDKSKIGRTHKIDLRLPPGVIFADGDLTSIGSYYMRNFNRKFLMVEIKSFNIDDNQIFFDLNEEKRVEKLRYNVNGLNFELVAIDLRALQDENSESLTKEKVSLICKTIPDVFKYSPIKTTLTFTTALHAENHQRFVRLSQKAGHEFTEKRIEEVEKFTKTIKIDPILNHVVSKKRCLPEAGFILVTDFFHSGKNTKIKYTRINVKDLLQDGFNNEYTLSETKSSENVSAHSIKISGEPYSTKLSIAQNVQSCRLLCTSCFCYLFDRYNFELLASIVLLGYVIKELFSPRA